MYTLSSMSDNGSRSHCKNILSFSNSGTIHLQPSTITFFVSMSIVKVACSKSNNVRLVNKNHFIVLFIIFYLYESNLDMSD